MQSSAVAATILDLCYKKKVELRASENEKVYIKMVGDSEGLKEDELEIYKLLKQVAKNSSSEEFEVNDIKKYANKKYYEYSNSITKLVNSARNSLYKIGLIDKKEEKMYMKYSRADSYFKDVIYVYSAAAMPAIIVHLPILYGRLVQQVGFSILNGTIWLGVLALPIAIAKAYIYSIKDKMKGNIAVLTQDGSDEKEQWKALARFMKEYSMLDEKDVFSLAIWEKYLIYATALGIANEVIKQMKAKYPEVFIEEKWDDEEMKQIYPIINFVANPRYHNFSEHTYQPLEHLGSGVDKAYSTSLAQIAAHSSSSGGRRWRRLLWWRRRPVVAGGRNGRQII